MLTTVNKSKLISFSLGLLALIAIVVYLSYRLGGSDNLYPEKRVIRYSIMVQNSGSKFIPEVKFWTLAPVKQTAFQVVREIKASIPYKMEADNLGNQKMTFKINGLPPYASKIVSIDVTLGIAKQANDTTDDAKRFTQPERFIESDDESIVALSRELEAGTERDTLKNIYKWVSSNLADTGYSAEDKGAVFALVNKKGDCTEHAYLFTALARANGIPSRVLAGYVHSQNAILRAKAYHNWVEVYFDKRWRVIDPDSKKFMENENHYIATYVIGGHDTDGAIQSQQFFGTSTKSVLVKLQQ